MPEYYWTLIIESGWVQAAIWTAHSEEKKASVVVAGQPVAFSGDDDFLTSADAALSSIVQELPPGSVEPTRTVFGVPASVVEAGEIKPDWLTKIKMVCSKLSLEPAGFVVLPEAIAYYLKQKENSPISAVVIGLSSENVDLSLFKLGNLAGSVSVSRSVSVVDDVVEGITRFHQMENIPSRFLLFDGREGDLEETRQQLVATDWEGKNLKFLHLPAIEIIDPREKVVAVSLAGASEIAGAVEIEVPRRAEPEPELSDLGLVNLSDVEPTTVKPEELGFVVGEDVANSAPPPSLAPRPEMATSLPVLTGGNFLAKIKASLRMLKNKFSFSSGPRIGKESVLSDSFRVGALIVSVLIILGFAAWWFLPKATVTVYVSPKKLTQSEIITIDTGGAATSLEERKIAGRSLAVTVDGEKTISTSGKKTVGEKAKGKVQIRNGTSSNVKLNSGTILVGGSDLKFTLDSSASISAATSPTSPGTAVVDVTAYSFGSEFNLAKGETFAVGNYPKSDVDAVAEIAFTGGSSREISAVSTEDRDSLEEDLIGELKENGKTKILDSVGSTDIFLSDAISYEAAQKDFSAKVGDEADSLELAATLEVKGVSVSRETMNNLAQEIFLNEVPTGFAFNSDQLEMQFELLKQKDELWEVEITYTVNLLPGVDTEDIAKKVRGKYPTLAQTYLSSVPGFVRAEIRLNPSLPGRLGTLPRVVKNISIEVASER